MNKVELTNLLGDLIGEINKIRDENKAQLRDHFNVFSAMRNHTDEVRLHSRFIAALLDPSAPHHLGTLPLHELLETIGIPSSIASEPCLSVTPNYFEKKEWNDIDILITTSRHAILIENKINHIDTNRSEDLPINGTIKLKGQLERYYRFVINDLKFSPENIFVVYLSKYGHHPNDVSVGADRKKPRYPELKDKVLSISYCQHILQWINDLITSTKNHQINIFLKQYMDIIEEITDSSGIEERKKLVRIIGDLTEDEKLTLCYLFANAKHIPWHCADNFWHTLIKRSQERNEISFAGLDWNGMFIDDSKRFDETIGKALTRIISENKNQEFSTVYSGVQGAKWYVTMDNSSNSLYISISSKYQNAETNKYKNLPPAVIEHLQNMEFIRSDVATFYWKYFTFKGAEIKLTEISCMQTILLAQEEHLVNVVDQILDELESAMKTVDKLISSK